MAGSSTQQSVETLERGNIYFLYRPRVEHQEVQGPQDVQQFYLVLSPQGAQIHRLAIIGRDRLPDPRRKGRERYWGFIGAVSKQPRELVDELGEQTYETKTRGERHRPPARPAGEGVYRILRHGNHTHLVYALELPDEPGEVQKAFHIEPEASYIISIKNPEAPAPPGVGLQSAGEVSYPKDLQEGFRGRKFADADPPRYLDHEGSQFVLIAASDDVSEELGIELHPNDEDESSADIFRSLELDKSEHPIGPLLQGRWE